MKTKTKNLLKGYYYLNSDINEENFPIPKKIETEKWKLIEMGKTSTSEEALAEIKHQGYRPANCWELAQWKIDHEAEIKGKFKWYVALGQTWTDAGGRHRVPSVDAYSDGDFYFNLGHFEGVWVGGNAFLCFCDSLSPSDTQKSSDSLTLETAVKMCVDNGYIVYKKV